jgi:hypothetical protein
MSWVAWRKGIPGAILNVVWVNDNGQLENSPLRESLGGVQYHFRATPFISFGELCLIVESHVDASSPTITILRLGRGCNNPINMRISVGYVTPHVSRLPDGDEIVVYAYNCYRLNGIPVFRIAFFRIYSKDKTYARIATIHDNEWVGYAAEYPIAYLPTMGKIIKTQRPGGLIYDDIIVPVVPTFVNGGGDINARVTRIFDTSGDHVLVLVRPEDGDHTSAIGFVADYNLSSSSLTILDMVIVSAYNARYAAENIVMSISATVDHQMARITRKVYNLTDGSNYVLTDEMGS